MSKEEFWTVDRLLPKITSNAYNKNSCGTITQKFNISSDIEYDEKRIYPRNSKIIRYYTIYAPKSEKISDADNDIKIINSLKEITESENIVPLNNISSFYELSKYQLSSYIHFKNKIENKEKISIYYPYIVLLFLEYALIDEKSNIDKVIDNIIFIWQNYKRDFPLIERFLSDFLLDFSLVNEIDIPYDKLKDVFTSTELSSLPFIYNTYIYDHLFAPEKKIDYNENQFIQTKLIKALYRNSVAYKSHKIYRYCVDSALNELIENGLFNDKILNDNLLNISIPSYVKTKRKLYPDIPISPKRRKYIEISYYPLLFDENIRSRTEELIRYIDNKVRYDLKIKNALSRINISAVHKAYIDKVITKYTSRFIGIDIKDEESNLRNNNKIAAENKPIIKINKDAAKKIEEASWESTEMLFEGLDIPEEESLSFSEDRKELNEADKIIKNDISQMIIQNSDFWEFAASLNEDEDEFMQIILHKGKDAARNHIASKGSFFESYIAECNRKAEDTIGDMIFDGAFEIYDEYIESLKEVFPL